MKPWKVMLGLGAACAACCAIPLFSAVAAFATLSSAFLVSADALAPAAWVAGAGMLFAGALWRWRRRAVRRAANGPCNPASCAGGLAHAND